MELFMETKTSVPFKLARISCPIPAGESINIWNWQPIQQFQFHAGESGQSILVPQFPRLIIFHKDKIISQQFRTLLDCVFLRLLLGDCREINHQRLLDAKDRIG